MIKHIFFAVIGVGLAACAAPNPQPATQAAAGHLAVSATPEMLAAFHEFCPQGAPVLLLDNSDPRQQYFQVACREADGKTAYGFGVGRGR